MEDKEYIQFLEQNGLFQNDIEKSFEILSECDCQKSAKVIVNKTNQYYNSKKKLNKIKDNLEEMIKLYSDGYGGINNIQFESSIDLDTNKKIGVDFILYNMNSYEVKQFSEHINNFFSGCSDDNKKEIIREALYRVIDELRIVDEQSLILREMITLENKTEFEEVYYKRNVLQKRLEENMNYLIDYCKTT